MINFDDEYKKAKCFWGTTPHPFVEKSARLKKNGDVLDIGVGEGRNSIFLAKNGFNVTGLDISPEGIKKFLTLASGLNVNGIISDIRDYKFDKKFDIILCISVLHFLSERDARNIISSMKANTKSGGINIVLVLLENPRSDAYNFRPGELRELYSDWDVIEYSEQPMKIRKIQNPDVPEMRNGAVIIAKNRNGESDPQ